jgi:Uma2 family endonuclease
MLLGKDGVRPDAAGWRHDLYPRPPQPVQVGKRKVMTEPPNWICEVLSPSTAATDVGPKLDIYHRAGVLHYWVISPADRTIVVYQRAPDGYLLIRTAGDNQMVRLLPFSFLEIDTSYLFLASPEVFPEGD